MYDRKYTWSSNEPPDDDRHAVLLRLDRQYGDDPEQEEDAGYPISVELLYVDTYLYHKDKDEEFNEEDEDWDENGIEELNEDEDGE